MQTWYYSPFAKEYMKYRFQQQIVFDLHTDSILLQPPVCSKLYHCEFCLAFYGAAAELARHEQRCELQHPPGNEIYRAQETNVVINVFEIDGQIEREYV